MVDKIFKLLILFLISNCNNPEFLFKENKKTISDSSKKGKLILIVKAFDKKEIYGNYYRLNLKKISNCNSEDEKIIQKKKNRLFFESEPDVNFFDYSYSGVIQLNKEIEMEVTEGNYIGIFETDYNEHISSFQAKRSFPLSYNDYMGVNIIFSCSIDNLKTQDENDFKTDFKYEELKINSSSKAKIVVEFEDKKFSLLKTSLGLIPIITFPLFPILHGFLSFNRKVNVSQNQDVASTKKPESSK